MKYNSKLNSYPIKKIIQCFCINIDATKTALLLNINRWYNIFRQKIYQYQLNQKNRLYSSVKVDESYFEAKRQRGYHGKLKRGRGTLKQPVFGIFERNGRVYTEI